jgi:hypothetical protein
VKVTSDRETIDDPSEAVIDPRVHLYAMIFVYAYYYILVTSDRKVRLEGIRADARPSDVARAMLVELVKNGAYLIRQIEDVSDEFIAARFRDAVSLVRRADGALTLKYASPEEILAVEIVETDPIYSYARAIYRMRRKPVPRASKPAQQTAKASAAEFNAVVGYTIGQLLERGRKTRDALGGRKRASLEAPGGLTFFLPASTVEDAVLLARTPRIALYDKLVRGQPSKDEKKELDRFVESSREAQDPYWAATVLRTWVGGARPKRAKRVKKIKPAAKSKAKRDSRRSDARFAGYSPELLEINRAFRLASYDSFRNYISVATGSELQKYQAEIKELLKVQVAYISIKASYALKPYRYYGWKESGNFPIDYSEPVTFLFDENGFDHVWSINIYADGAELTKEDINAMLMQGQMRPPHLVDVRCSVCQVLFSKFRDLDAEVARQARALITQLSTFFNYYETRCPERTEEPTPAAKRNRTPQEYHSFDSENQCTKCKYRPVFRQKPRSPPAKAYYEKYKKQYEGDREEIGGTKTELSTEPPDEPVVEPEVAPGEEIAGESAVVVLEFGEVLKAAEMAGVAPGVFETLGLAERQEYDQLTTNPAFAAAYLTENPIVQVDDPRIINVDAALRMFSVLYNMVRYYYRLPRDPRTDIAGALLKKSGVPQFEHDQLPQLLPSSESLGLGTTYQERKKAFETAVLRGERTAGELREFIVMTIAQAANQMANLTNKKVAKLGRLVAVEGVRRVIQDEKYTGKPGRFNFNIFGVGYAYDGETQGQLSLPDDQAPGYAEEDQEGPDYDEVEEPDQVYQSFSYDGMDYDGYNDEPG